MPGAAGLSKKQHLPGLAFLEGLLLLFGREVEAV